MTPAILLTALVALSAYGDDARVFNVREAGVIGPFERQLAADLKATRDGTGSVRRHAVERLGMLRATAAEARLSELLHDAEAEVRRQAAQSLAWCGGRAALSTLVTALGDADWMTRQAAAYALENLTGMAFAFDATAAEPQRKEQAAQWAQWLVGVKPNVVPEDLVALAASTTSEELLRAVRALGALGGEGAAKRVVDILERTRPLTKPVIDQYTAPQGQALVEVDEAPVAIQQAGLRALGRLKDPATFDALAKALRANYWSRYAADALGEWGDPKAVPLLLDMLKTGTICHDIIQMGNAKYSSRLLDRYGAHNGGPHTNPDMFFILSALCRLPLSEADCVQLRSLTYDILYQTPWVHDRGIVLEPHAVHLYAACLLERTGMAKPLAEALLAKAEGRTPDPASLPEALLAKLHEFNPSAIGWLCARPEFAPQLIALLSPDQVKAASSVVNMNRIMAVKALTLLRHQPAVESIARILSESKTDAAHGYSVQHRRSDYLDPLPRWRLVFALALGQLGDQMSAPLLIRLMNSEEECLDTRYAAGHALGQLATPEALIALQTAAIAHSFHSIRILAREYLVRSGQTWEQGSQEAAAPLAEIVAERPAPALVSGELPEEIVFIKGEPAIQRFYYQDPWRQVYHLTDNGSEPRLGRNLFVLNLKTKIERPLTAFTNGFVGSCEVSYDGTRVLFARREEHVPWWHVYEINTDGSKLRKITSGPYHHANPNYLPDGRIIFVTSRLGHRDEYHAYQAQGLAVMKPDGTDIQVVGINVARDGDPSVLSDGRVVFNRIDNMYGMLKIENLIYSMFPDGTSLQNLYGPERRVFWWDLTYNKYRQSWGWMAKDRFGAVTVTQPQCNGQGQGIVACSPFGLIQVGADRFKEKFLHDVSWAVTTPFPLGSNTFLCAAGKRNMDPYGLQVRRAGESFYNRVGNMNAQPNNYSGAFFSNEVAVQMNANLGLYLLNSQNGSMELLHQDPFWACYEARPIASRVKPQLLSVRYDRRDATGIIQCQSIRNTRDADVAQRGRWIRIIASRAFNQRHDPGFSNHQGSVARILGTYPVAVDGSFNLEVPADQLLQCQVLDADRVPIGTQYLWMTVRPGEKHGCVGCHESPNTSPAYTSFMASRMSPEWVFPDGNEFTYEATTARRFFAFMPTTTEEALPLTSSFSNLARP